MVLFAVIETIVKLDSQLHHVSIKSYCNDTKKVMSYTLLFWYHLITKLQLSIPRTDSRSTLKPIWLLVATIIIRPFQYYMPHEVAANSALYDEGNFLSIRYLPIFELNTKLILI